MRRKARAVTQSDFRRAGRAFVSDVARDMAELDRQKAGQGVPLSTDPAEREEQVNALARQEVPRPVTVASLLADLEAVLEAPHGAKGADNANRERISAAWKLIHTTRKRIAP